MQKKQCVRICYQLPALDEVRLESRLCFKWFILPYDALVLVDCNRFVDVEDEPREMYVSNLGFKIKWNRCRKWCSGFRFLSFQSESLAKWTYRCFPCKPDSYFGAHHVEGFASAKATKTGTTINWLWLIYYQRGAIEEGLKTMVVKPWFFVEVITTGQQRLYYRNSLKRSQHLALFHAIGLLLSYGSEALRNLP